MLVWLGGLGYLLYNALMFVFATPMNTLFLGYVAMLSLALWSVVAVLVHTDVPGLGQRFTDRLPVRGLAGYVWVIVTLNALAWLGPITRGLVDGDPAAMLDGTGLISNPVYVQDLAVWLPLMAAAAWWLWQRRPWGHLVVPSVLVMWVVESVGIATDQWFGHRADPSSTVVSAALVPAFAVLAVVGLSHWSSSSRPAPDRPAAGLTVASRVVPVVGGAGSPGRSRAAIRVHRGRAGPCAGRGRPGGEPLAGDQPCDHHRGADRAGVAVAVPVVAPGRRYTRAGWTGCCSPGNWPSATRPGSTAT